MHRALKTVFLALAITAAAMPAAAGEELPAPVEPWLGGNHEKCNACHEPGNNVGDSRPGAETCIGCY
jgi:uncharacterized membrane protein